MNWDTAKNVRTIRADYHQLCHLSHHYVQDTSAPLYVGYYRSRPHCMILCTLINFKWKISTHVASSGMMVGGLLSYSFIFNFNPVWWLCFFILLSGMLGTARIIVKQHTLLEVLAGFIIGLFCGVIGILFI